MSKLMMFLPTLNAIALDTTTTVSHFEITMRDSRNGERHFLDHAVVEDRSGAHGRTTRTDNRKSLIKSDTIDLSDKRFIDYLYNEVDMFRVKVNDKGSYMVDIIIKPKGE